MGPESGTHMPGSWVRVSYLGRFTGDASGEAEMHRKRWHTERKLAVLRRGLVNRREGQRTVLSNPMFDETTPATPLAVPRRTSLRFPRCS